MNGAEAVLFPGSNVLPNSISWISLLDNNLVNESSGDFDGDVGDRSLSAKTSFELLTIADLSWDLRICERSEIAGLDLFFSDL